MQSGELRDGFGHQNDPRRISVRFRFALLFRHRCVVTALTEDGPADLAEELAKSETIVEPTNRCNADLFNWKTWNPDPVKVNPGS